MSEYKSSEIQNLFGISHETVRRWADEYREYLSEGANPGSGKHRVFNDDDLQVFALVTNMKSNDMSGDEILVALKTGQRGDVPTQIDERALEIGTNLQLSITRQQIKQLRGQLDQAVEEAQKWRDKANQLEGKIEAFQDQLNRADSNQSGLIELHQEIARLKLLLEMERDKNKPNENE